MSDINNNPLFLKIANVQFKDRGMLKDNSRSIALLTPELNSEDSGLVSELHKKGEICVIFMSQDMAETVEELLLEIQELSNQSDQSE